MSQRFYFYLVCAVGLFPIIVLTWSPGYWTRPTPAVSDIGGALRVAGIVMLIGAVGAYLHRRRYSSAPPSLKIRPTVHTGLAGAHLLIAFAPRWFGYNAVNLFEIASPSLLTVCYALLATFFMAYVASLFLVDGVVEHSSSPFLAVSVSVLIHVVLLSNQGPVVCTTGAVGALLAGAYYTRTNDLLGTVVPRVIANWVLVIVAAFS